MPVSEPFSSAKFADDPLPASAVAWAARTRQSPNGQMPWRHDSHQPRAIPASCAQFVLDRHDVIQAYNVGPTIYWFFQEPELKGKSLRKLLAQLRPDWDRLLPAALAGQDNTLYLPEAVPGAHGVAMALHRMSHGELTIVSAVPELPPPDHLRELGIGDFSPDAQTFAKLFLRLRSVEARLDHYLSHLPGVVFYQRADLSFSHVGPGAERLLGTSADTLCHDSQALLRLIHPGDERLYYQELDRFAEATQPFSLVYRVVHPQTGACSYLLDVRSPVRSRTGLVLGYEGVWLDITKQKIAEHRLTTRAWKECFATLTGALLHDFGNVMTGIFSLSELYHNTLPPKHPLHDGLGLIKSNAAQAQQLVRRILDLNREGTGDKTYANLGKLIIEQLDLLKLILPRGSLIQAPVADGDWPVYIDESGFRQTIVHLAMNARDALRTAGEVRITLRKIGEGELPLVDTVPALDPVTQPTVELVFADSGSGISPTHIARIFDPFFSTKQGSRGAGLGLYNARLFVEAHGGKIAARSSLGRGAEIVMLFPLADLSLLNQGSRPPTGSPVLRIRAVHLDAEGTEDAPLTEILRQRGWEVYSVATSDHVRRVLREEGVRLDMLIIRHRDNEADLRLLLAEIRRDHPGLPIVLSLSRKGLEEVPASIRTQVDLALAGDIRDRDAVDSMTKLLRLP
jgi:signal transduction histidine kinase